MAQQLLQPPQRQRDVGEIALVVGPEMPQMVRGRHQQIEIDPLQRLAMVAMRLDTGDRAIIIRVQHQFGKVGGFLRRSGDDRGHALDGCGVGHHEPRNDLGFDRVVELRMTRALQGHADARRRRRVKAGLSPLRPEAGSWKSGCLIELGHKRLPSI